MKISLGRPVLTLGLVATMMVVPWFQWNATHVFNPEWHPHARFHAVQLNGFVVSMSIVGLWLLWRTSKEPVVGILAAGLIPALFWVGELYAAIVSGY